MAKYTFAEHAKMLEDEATRSRYVADAVEIIRREVKVHGPRMVLEEIAAVSPQPVDRATYKRSWHAEDVEGGATLYNSAPHAAIIELGRRAGSRRPPISAIEGWVHRKGLAAPRSRTGKVIRSGMTGDAYRRRVRSIAYVVAAAIGRRGLPAHHILEIAAGRLAVAVRAALDRGLFVLGPR